MRRSLLFAFAAALAAMAGHAQSSTLHIHVKPTQANDGKLMYQSYCAPCHGVEGRGNGPTAEALVTQPPDLTTLTRNNHGKFPERYLASVLRFGAENSPAHGSKLMPTWGPIFYRLNSSTGAETMETLRINNLVAYIKTLQK
jgi:mono/diheme cytochrome c family protein